MNVEIGAEAALFPEKEYISGIFVAVQAWGCPCFMKCLFKDIRSPLTPPLLCTCVYMKTRFWKLADNYKYAHIAQPIGEIFPSPPLSFCRGGG
jgi:hypothetical protein